MVPQRPIPPVPFRAPEIASPLGAFFSSLFPFPEPQGSIFLPLRGFVGQDGETSEILAVCPPCSATCAEISEVFPPQFRVEPFFA